MRRKRQFGVVWVSQQQQKSAYPSALYQLAVTEFAVALALALALALAAAAAADVVAVVAVAVVVALVAVTVGVGGFALLKRHMVLYPPFPLCPLLVLRLHLRLRLRLRLQSPRYHHLVVGSSAARTVDYLPQHQVAQQSREEQKGRL